MRFEELREEDSGITVRWAGPDEAFGRVKTLYSNSRDTLLWVDILDLLNKTNKMQEIPVTARSKQDHENVIGNRIALCKQFWKEGNYMNPAEVEWMRHTGGDRGIHFTDGRHRLVAAYQLGEHKAPVFVPTSNVVEFKRHVEGVLMV